VTDVVPKGPAYRAGIRERDIILTVGESVVTGVDDMQRVLTRDAIGRATSVILLRAGVQLTLTVTPTERSIG
jgi:S1-C subfamily serine protease